MSIPTIIGLRRYAIPFQNRHVYFLVVLSFLFSTITTVFGLANGRYIPKGGRLDLPSPQAVLYHWIVWTRTGNAFSHPNFHVPRLAVGKPGEISLQLVHGGPCRVSREGHLRAHSSRIGMHKESLRLGPSCNDSNRPLKSVVCLLCLLCIFCSVFFDCQSFKLFLHHGALPIHSFTA